LSRPTPVYSKDKSKKQSYSLSTKESGKNSQLASTSESNNSNSEDSTEQEEDAQPPERTGEEQQADMEDETGLLPDSQAPPRETTSERPREEIFGTDEFGVPTIHGIPQQLWCTTQQQRSIHCF
jgi:hypothetical protein